MKMVLRISIAALLLFGATGCAQKLAKEDAKRLLSESAAPSGPTCTIHTADAKLDLLKKSGNLTYSSAEWGEFASSLGFVSDPKCERDGGADATVCSATVNETMQSKCEEQPSTSRMKMGLGLFSRDCTLTLPCGRAEIEIESIVTEGSRATVNYAVKRTVDQKFTAATGKAPTSAKFRVSGSDAEKKTASALLTDDKKWILSK